MSGQACGVDWGLGPGKTVLTVVEQGPGGQLRIVGVADDCARWDETDTWLHAYDRDGKHVLSVKKKRPGPVLVA